MAKIIIDNLKITCTIGTLPHEKTTPQDIYVDITISTDVSAAAQSDDLTQSIDYTKIAELCISTASQCHHELLENLAYEMIKSITYQLDIDNIRLKIKKPAAIADADYTAIELVYPEDFYA